MGPGRVGTGRDGDGGTRLGHFRSPGDVPWVSRWDISGHLRDSLLTSEFAALVPTLLTFTFTLIFTVSFNLGLQWLIFTPFDEHVTRLIVVLCVTPKVGFNKIIRNAFISTKFLNHERRNEPVCQVVC